MEDIAGIVAIISVFGVAPAIVFHFIYKSKKLKYQKELLELEIEKQKNELKLLEEENKKYDRIINEPPKPW
jgi:hypothetical protein